MVQIYLVDAERKRGAFGFILVSLGLEDLLGAGTVGAGGLGEDHDGVVADEPVGFGGDVGHGGGWEGGGDAEEATEEGAYRDGCAGDEEMEAG